MRAVITGATGAVGMALINELLSRDISVTVLCRASSERSKNIPDDARVQKIDCPLDKMNELTLGEKHDMFFHLAWDGTTGASRNDMYLQNTNVRYTLDAVRLAHRSGCGVFVGAGSQAEYGRATEKLCSNTPTFPENGYGIAKLCAGQMSRKLCQELGIKHIWTRILSVYGEFDGERSLVMSTIIKLLNGERPSFTAGEQIWDYMYSGDTAKAMTELAFCGKDGGIYCLGSGNARPLREYIEVIKDKINPEAELGFGEIPYSSEQVMLLCADTQELERDTGFVPFVDFETGISRTIDWYIRKENLKK